MTDKELIQQRIDELQEKINSAHQTGKTYRAINKIIDELFNNPIGTQVRLTDIDGNNDPDSLREFVNKFAMRMTRDFPETFFKVTYPAPSVAIAIRLTETYQEVAKKRLAQWKEKLAKLD